MHTHPSRLASIRKRWEYFPDPDFVTPDTSTHWVLKAPLCDSCSAHIVIQPRADKQAFIHTMRDQKLWTRSMKGFIFLGVGGNWSARKKKKKKKKNPTKVGMESANQIHIQPLASCIGERKMFEH